MAYMLCVVPTVISGSGRKNCVRSAILRHSSVMSVMDGAKHSAPSSMLFAAEMFDTVRVRR